MECRRVVIAAGSASTRLLEPLGLSLPVRPVKGYSVTIDVSANPADLPRMPIVDDAMHAAVTPLGSRLRIAGTAEFAGMNRTLRQACIDNLFHLLDAIFPRIAAYVDRGAALAWTGLRPMSADGTPFIGQMRIPGVYVSTGHGHLGWTMALGSARLLADLMLGNEPAIDPRPYRATRP
jgi:D-amino-acid dehydrogenase